MPITATIDINPNTWTGQNLVNALAWAVGTFDPYDQDLDGHCLTNVLIGSIERRGMWAMEMGCNRPEHVDQRLCELVREHFSDFRDDMPTYEEDTEDDL